MDMSSGEVLPPERHYHPTDQVVVGALSRAGHWLAVARDAERPKTPAVVDAALGAGQLSVYVVGGAVAAGWRLARPIRTLVAHPPLVPERYHPATFVAALVTLGQQYRLVSELAADAVVARILPEVVDSVVGQLDLTALVRESVDLDRVVAAVDIGAVLRRLDLTSIVIEQVDVDAIVRTVDIEAVIDRVDINEIVEQKIDVSQIIDRLDIATIALQVIDEIDLPEIIRQSTASVASEAVRGVRMQSIGADQVIQRTVDRILLRRHERATQAPGQPDHGQDET